jgi:hypothetical protein
MQTQIFKFEPTRLVCNQFWGDTAATCVALDSIVQELDFMKRQARWCTSSASNYHSSGETRSFELVWETLLMDVVVVKEMLHHDSYRAQWNIHKASEKFILGDLELM